MPEDGRRSFEWRKTSPIRPVVFSAPEGIDDDIVQLHLEHRVAHRLLGRFLAQGFVHHDLSRACLAQTADAIPRVLMLGRLSLYGRGAVRLHEELLTVTARWLETERRTGALSPYGREAEARTMDLLEESLRPRPDAKRVPEVVRERLLGAIAKDIEELLPHLESRAHAARADAEKRLAERGQKEADALRAILEDQRRRVADALGKPIQFTLDLGHTPAEEVRQLESNRRYWQRWLDNVDGDLRREPARIVDFYTPASFRVEPVGIAYLWPVTG